MILMHVVRSSLQKRGPLLGRGRVAGFPLGLSEGQKPHKVTNSPSVGVFCQSLAVSISKSFLSIDNLLFKDFLGW